MKKYIALFVVFSIFFLINCGQQAQQPLKKEVISSANAPKAIGPYSQAIKVGNMLFCSGQIAIDPKTGKLYQGDIKEEAKRVLENLKAVLNEAGMDFKDVVRATVFLRDINDYGAVNEVYGSYFTESPPARAAIQVGKLPKNAGVEISCIAVKTE